MIFKFPLILSITKSLMQLVDIIIALLNARFHLIYSSENYFQMALAGLGLLEAFFGR